MPSQTVKNDLKAKNIKLPQMNFFPKKTNEILKKLLELIQSYEDVPFSGPKWPISPEQLFWYKPLLLLSSIIVQNLKKFLQRIHRYDDAAFLGPKWSISPKQIFIFGKLLSPFSSTY